MKIRIDASSIMIPLAYFFLLSGCGMHVPDIFGHDEVPDEVKAQPRMLEIPPPSTELKDWPRLGDVPFKPKDFSLKPDYDRSMDVLEKDRAEAEDAKKKALETDPAPSDAATQNSQNRPIQSPQLH